MKLEILLLLFQQPGYKRVLKVGTVMREGLADVVVPDGIVFKWGKSGIILEYVTLKGRVKALAGLVHGVDLAIKLHVEGVTIVMPDLEVLKVPFTDAQKIRYSKYLELLERTMQVRPRYRPRKPKPPIVEE